MRGEGAIEEDAEQRGPSHPGLCPWKIKQTGIKDTTTKQTERRSGKETQGELSFFLCLSVCLSLSVSYVSLNGKFHTNEHTYHSWMREFLCILTIRVHSRILIEPLPFHSNEHTYIRRCENSYAYFHS